MALDIYMMMCGQWDEIFMTVCDQHGDIDMTMCDQCCMGNIPTLSCRPRCRRRKRAGVVWVTFLQLSRVSKERPLHVEDGVGGSKTK